MFRILAPIAFFGLLIVGGYYAISSTSIETRLTKKLATLIPDEVQGSVRLEGCMLQVSFAASVKSKGLDYFLNANLGSRLIKLDPQPDRGQFDHSQEVA